MLFKVMLVFNFILLCLIRSRLSCLGSIILLLTPYTKDLQRKFLFSETQGLLDSLQRTFKSMKCDFLTPDLVNLLRYLGDEFCATLSSFLCTRPRNSSCSPHSILAQKSNLPAPGETVKKKCVHRGCRCPVPNPDQFLPTLLPSEPMDWSLLLQNLLGRLKTILACLFLLFKKRT